MALTVETSRSIPRSADAVGFAVATTGAVPRQLGLTRAALTAHGFDGKVGQTLVVPSSSGPTYIAVGIGDFRKADASDVRDAAAALARAAARRTHVATNLVDSVALDARSAAQAAVEGFTLASYRYTELKSSKGSVPTLLTLTAASARARSTETGIERGRATAGAATLARDLANTPPAYLTARILADRAVDIARASGLGVEVFDNDKLEVMGCGGLLGVNRGSTEPARMVKLTYTPSDPQGHLVMVGKGVTYDSGGISLKPSDGMHGMMKMDMSGAAAVLSAMSTLKALRCRTAVTGYLMCTDNRPSGSAMAMGDVLTFRNGKTSEILNTDAEGRLILCDALTYAERFKPDTVIDIATLTGAVISALGKVTAGLLSNDDQLAEQLLSSGTRSGDRAWRLPLYEEYDELLKSNFADIANIGGPQAGTITAACFLARFTKKYKWAHLDVAGTAWLSGAAKGSTGRPVPILMDYLRSKAG